MGVQACRRWRSSPRTRAPAIRSPFTRGYAAEMSPDWKRTVHCLGDLHAGAITRARMEAVSRDIEQLGPPALHVQVGDATEGGREHEDMLAREFLDALPARWVTALGNHDILHNDRTVADWGRAYGQQLAELHGGARLRARDRDRAGSKRAGPARRPALERARCPSSSASWPSTDTDCWVVCHWPLLRTVMGDPRLHFTSAMEAFHAKPDAGIRKLLARHRNAKVWISGHTHSPLSAPGLIKRTRLAPKRSIVAVNASALVGIGKRRDPRAPLCSLYLTHRPGCLEVRSPGPPGRGVAKRCEGARSWRSPSEPQETGAPARFRPYAIASIGLPRPGHPRRTARQRGSGPGARGRRVDRGHVPLVGRREAARRRPAAEEPAGRDEDARDPLGGPVLQPRGAGRRRRSGAGRLLRPRRARPGPVRSLPTTSSRAPS